MGKSMVSCKISLKPIHWPNETQIVISGIFPTCFPSEEQRAGERGDSRALPGHEAQAADMGIKNQR